MILSPRRGRWVFIIGVALISAACANPLYVAGIKFIYTRAPLPPSQIYKNISYAPLAESPKQRLDLYTPATTGWPVVVFVHGGNWTEGDRALTIGSADVYGNIGRFLAGHGYGTAVISYRLIPDVDWQVQADDVSMALKWVYDTAPAYGAKRDAIVMMGHSAGAQLAIRTAIDEDRLRRMAVPRSAIRGIIAVSGAGYDLTDEQTYSLGAGDAAFYEQRFRRSASDTNWRQRGSILPFTAPNPPPTLVMFAGGESLALKRQSQLLAAALKQAGAPTTVLETQGLSHTRIVPTLSREDRVAGAAILSFLRTTFGQ